MVKWTDERGRRRSFKTPLAFFISILANQQISTLDFLTFSLISKISLVMGTRTDLFTSPDYFLLDELLTDEQKLVRESVRNYVKCSL